MGNTNSDPGGVPPVEGSPPIVVEATDKHTASVIFLHGLGDQGNQWADIFKDEVKLPHVKFIFPNAATRSVSMNLGFRMPAWYDLFGITMEAPEDDEGIQRATEYVHNLLNIEIEAGIPSERIAVGGFSMGGALATYAGLTFDKPLGGILGLSSIYLLQRSKLPGSHTANLKTPIFLAHGTQDHLAPLELSKATYDAIIKFNPNVELKTYTVDHSSCPEEMVDVKAFLAKNLA